MIGYCKCIIYTARGDPPLENVSLLNLHSKNMPPTPPTPGKHNYPSDLPHPLEKFSGSMHVLVVICRSKKK